jgi:hypothetical protein
LFLENSLSDDTSLILQYIGFLAFDIFHQKNKAAPGIVDADADSAKLSSVAWSIVEGIIGSDDGMEVDELDEIKEKLNKVCEEM